MRASDAERERVAAALRRHHVDGRLDTDELQDRLGRCYAARTTGELAELLADLPSEEEPGPTPPRRLAWPGGAVAAVVLVALTLATVGALAHGHPGPLPILAVFLLVRLARRPRGPHTAWGHRV